MAVFKSQFTRALTVIPSNNCNIPFPAPIVSSFTTGTCIDTLMTDTTVDFIELNVKTGDIIYCYPSDFAATVVSVVDANTLELNICGIGNGDPYTIYQASPQTGLGNTGCYLMSSAEVTASVTTVGGDEVIINLNQFVHYGLQVVKLSSISGEATLTALW
jgi:hypothetical protein